MISMADSQEICATESGSGAFDASESATSLLGAAPARGQWPHPAGGHGWDQVKHVVFLMLPYETLSEHFSDARKLHREENPTS